MRQGSASITWNQELFEIRRMGARVANVLRAATLLGSVIALCACATGRTLVVEPAKKTTFAAARIVEEQPTVSVPGEVEASFKESLTKKLYDPEKGKFVSGDGLVVRYQFIQYTAGNRFSRWFWGGIGNAGEASTTIKVLFEDVAGAQLGDIQVEGRIGSGFFGGASKDALERASDQVVEYAIANFH